MKERNQGQKCFSSYESIISYICYDLNVVAVQSNISTPFCFNRRCYTVKFCIYWLVVSTSASTASNSNLSLFPCRKNLLWSSLIMTKGLWDVLELKAVSFYLLSYACETILLSCPFSLDWFWTFVLSLQKFSRGWTRCCLVLVREGEATWMPSMLTIFCCK